MIFPVIQIINAPPAYANALRRTLISNVPSVAIEIIGIVDNTGIMPDEILCHRIGLIPINVDPKYLEFRKTPCEDTSNEPKSVLLFGMNVVGGDCPTTDRENEPNYDGINSSWEGKLPEYYTGPSGVVYSSHLVWMPFADQTSFIPPVYPLHTNVPITKLRPGQRIHLYGRAIKSVGVDHAKFSPVCTAFYRFVPKIVVSPSLSEKSKKLLVESCSQHVFDIEDSELVIKNPRNCTSCRECIRPLQLQKSVIVGKETNIYEFTVESVRVRPAPTLVLEALKILQEKCNQIKELIAEPEPTNKRRK